MVELYNNVKGEEIFSPLSRSWYKENFNQADLTICDIKLSSIPEKIEKEISQIDFVNSADLT